MYRNILDEYNQKNWKGLHITELPLKPIKAALSSCEEFC